MERRWNVQQIMVRGMRRVFHYPGEFFSHHHLNRRLVRQPLQRIQELDGGFFERFGSLLKEQQTSAEAVETVQDDVDDEVVEEEVNKETSANLLAEAVGLNIEELYSEVLYEVIHTVGCMAEAEERDVIFNHLQKSFRLDPEKHELLLQQAKSKEVQ
uniref:Uncharacterized protein n=1 Tax=Graphocephala atropunctata TaxID=36148 RepID=A0A1B6LQM9_9HEMI